jgi:transposase
VSVGHRHQATEFHQRQLDDLLSQPWFAHCLARVERDIRVVTDVDMPYVAGSDSESRMRLHRPPREAHVKLLRDWNKFIPEYNAVVRARTHGRPLAASEAQQRQVLALRKGGTSLREIVNITGLSLRTVRTVIGKADGTDRTTRRTNELRRLELNRAAMASYRARKRTRDALPKRIGTDLSIRGNRIRWQVGLNRADSAISTRRSCVMAGA